MSAARLPFLYPQLFRPLRVAAEPLVSRSAATRRPRQCMPTSAAAGDRCNLGCRRTYSTRHGTAVQPSGREARQASARKKEKSRRLAPADEGAETTKLAAQADEPKADASSSNSSTRSTDSSSSNMEAATATSTSPTETETTTLKSDVGEDINSGAGREEAPPPVSEDADAQQQDQQAQPQQQHPVQSGSPMEKVLHLGAPEDIAASAKAEATHPPPRYVHHFDSYETVKRLAAAGFTQDQGVTVMKALRVVLADKVLDAQEQLVSRGDVDNETYLFKAACSELSTEVKNNGRAADEVTREQRMRLQHEVDIIGQSMNQELAGLNDNIRGQFNDRKMAVREEQKAIENSIQQINYKIGTTLSSDAKTEMEGLRWVLIRRSAIALGFMAVVVLAALRYSLYNKQQLRVEEERERRAAEEQRRLAGTVDRSSPPDAAMLLALGR